METGAGTGDWTPHADTALAQGRQWWSCCSDDTDHHSDHQDSRVIHHYDDRHHMMIDSDHCCDHRHMVPQVTHIDCQLED